MTDKEELELVLRLINKHHLPLSPILEYAIRERIEAYSGLCDTTENKVCEDFTICSDSGSLVKYLNFFSKLSVNITKDKKAPNKAILLLAIISLIENGELSENRIPPNIMIINAFANHWLQWYPNSMVPSIWKPYYHMKSEPFWHFMSKCDARQIDELNSFRGTMPIGTLRTLVEYAYLDDALFHYMQNSEVRSKLRETLIRNYIRCE